MNAQTRDAYSRRADEYIEHLGSMASVHPSDAQLVSAWVAEQSGPIIDAGCGPGHWTAFLAERVGGVRGVDVVPRFVEHARATFPEQTFDIESVDALSAAPASVGGILSWYSLIHHEPGSIQVPLREFARALRPEGGLLLGLFTGPSIERFDHAVVGAYFWPVEALSAEVQAAGFDIVETHTRTGQGYRSHGAILARRRADA
jgi:SAM-dependent methyltransferase